MRVAAEGAVLEGAAGRGRGRGPDPGGRGEEELGGWEGGLDGSTWRSRLRGARGARGGRRALRVWGEKVGTEGLGR